MIVVDVERDPGRRRVSAERAHAALRLEDRVILVRSKTELVAQVDLAQRLEATVTVLLAPRFQSLRIRLLPRLDACDLALAILSVPRFAARARA